MMMICLEEQETTSSMEAMVMMSFKEAKEMIFLKVASLQQA